MSGVVWVWRVLSAYCELSNRLERRSQSMLRADFFPGLEGRACSSDRLSNMMLHPPLTTQGEPTIAEVSRALRTGNKAPFACG